MTEEDARGWIRERFGVSRETALVDFVAALDAESRLQNLIAASTLEHVWVRHIVDSAQLVALAEPAGEGSWVDIGTGAGLPGVVAAILVDRPVILIEPRARRAEFLRTVVADLGLGAQVSVAEARVEAVPRQKAAIITARAVMALDKLFAAARHIAGKNTLWVLPKGRNAESEVAAARAAWQGSFHVEQSITQPDSLIVVAREVHAR